MINKFYDELFYFFLLISSKNIKFAFNKHLKVIKSPFIFRFLLLQTTPHKLKKRSTNTDEAGIFNRLEKKNKKNCILIFNLKF
jgi:hypothetical protein